MRFDILGLPEPILAGIRDAGFERCTPVQEETLPELLAGRNVAAQAQTGTGKTALFVIGMLARMLNNPRPDDAARRTGDDVRGRAARDVSYPRALVLAPTRELADQIAKEAALLGRHCHLNVVAVFGGVGYDQQERDLPACDILVATPGRLIDFYKNRKISFEAIEVLVIDEADRMFDMGFIPDVRYLRAKLPTNREIHTQLYSATLTGEVKRLAYEFMPDYVEVLVAPDQVTVDQVEEEMYHLKREERMPALLGLLATEAPKRTLIFCNQKRDVERVAFSLYHNGFKAAMWTGDVPQNRRMRILEALRDGELPVVVASDVACRGIHIEAVDLVVNYDLPNEAVNYVHRIGRTARAGRTGKAITLAAGSSVYNIPEIEAYLGREIRVAQITDDLFVPDRSPRFRFGEFQRIPLDKILGTERAKEEGEGRGRRRRRRRGEESFPAAEQPARPPEAAPPASESTGQPPAAAADQPERRRRRHRGGRGRRGGRSDREGLPLQMPAPSPTPVAAEKKEPTESRGRRSRKKHWDRADSVPADTLPAHAPASDIRSHGWLSRVVRRLMGRR